MIREYLERRRTRKIISKILSPDAIEHLLSGKSAPRVLREGLLEFTVVAVDGNSPSVISERIATICECAIKHKGLIDCIVSSLVVIIYGSRPFNSNPIENTEKRLSLVADLEKTMKSQIKIVHGAADGHFGLLGNDDRMSYSFILPGFLETLAALSNLKFGETKEIKLET